MSELFQSFTSDVSSRHKSLNNNQLYHLENLSVNFGATEALKGITMSVTPGEILFITGKSGAGKSTLLNVLAGDIKATGGRVQLPQSKSIFISQVFQDLKLLENMTCEENLWYSFDSSLYKSRSEFHEDLVELSQVLGVRDHLSKKVSELNGGMKQKVALIRALLSRPNVLLADEPTCSLDKESSIKLFEILNFYNLKRNLTVIWASHNRELVKQFPGKIIHLEKGKLIYSGHACFI